jgi:hypothetical protein
MSNFWKLLLHLKGYSFLCFFAFCQIHIRDITHGHPAFAICVLSHGFVGGQTLLFQLKVCHVANGRPICLYTETFSKLNSHTSPTSLVNFYFMLVVLGFYFFIIWWVNGRIGLRRRGTFSVLIGYGMTNRNWCPLRSWGWP